MSSDAVVAGTRVLPAALLATGRIWGLALLAPAAAARLPFAPLLLLQPPSLPMLVNLRVGATMVGVGLALAVSLLTWNTLRVQPLNFVFAGFGFFAAAVLGAALLVLLPGIPGMADPALAHEVRLATALGLAAASAAVIGLWAAALGPQRPGSASALRVGIALTGAGVVAGFLLAVGASRGLPVSEYGMADAELTLAAGALIAAALLFGRHRRGQPAYGPLAAAAVLGAVAMAFSSRLQRHDLSSALFDDVYKAFACLLVHRTLFSEGVPAPWHRLVATGRAVAEDRQRWRLLFESAPDGLLLVRAAGTIVEANPAAAAMFGWPVAELMGQRVEALLPPSLQAGHERMREHFLAAPRMCQIGRDAALQAERRHGEAFPVEVALAPQSSSAGRITLCIVRDVTERRRLEQSLLRQALHDTPTGPPNRRHFRDSVTKALDHAERHGGRLAVLFIDLDDFKHVNDTLGHSHGDELLRQVAQRLGRALRAGDLQVRKVLLALAPHFAHGGQTMQVGTSLGITMYPSDGRHVEELLSNADLAMYRAKAQGRNTWCFFEQRMTERVRQRSSLQQDLARAIERGQFHLVFQPRVCAGDGRLAGFESLLRWRHPVHGPVSPDVFIALAEESGQIVSIGEWVLRESCAQAARWLAGGGPDALTLAVNVSTHQLRHPGFAACLQEVLADTGWPASQLELEITKTALMQDPREAANLLHRVAALGVRLAVDDFGTGYSSLAYLKVPAEGIETPRQRGFLVRQQGDELQGYLFSAPISAAACQARMNPAAPVTVPVPH